MPYSDSSFEFPRSRVEFYQKSTLALLEQWQKDHNQFRGDDKRRILNKLALFNQDQSLEGRRDRRSIDRTMLLSEIQQILPSLALDPKVAPALLDEIIERSGLMIKVDGGAKYQFSHLTLQEYFSAEALREDEAGLIERFREDPTLWQEVVKLWCGLAGDSTNLITQVNPLDPVTSLECLADAQFVDPLLADKILSSYKAVLHTGTVNDLELRGIAAVAADQRPNNARGPAMFEFLQNLLMTSNDQNIIVATAQSLSRTNLPKAASVLAQSYRRSETIQAALVRMGDLAVPQLKILLSQINSSEDRNTLLDDVLTWSLD